MLNANSMRLRLGHLSECIELLKGQQSLSLEEYLSNRVIQGSVERYFQVAIECCADMASHLIAAYGLRRPAERRDVFRVLGEAGYLDSDYAAIMVRMVQLRNRLVHLYWDIDPQQMYRYLQEDVVHLERFQAFTLALLEHNERQATT